MPLRDIITNKLVSCSHDTTITDVADLMKSENVGAVLVLKDDKPFGIVTDRDIVMRCVCDQVGLDKNVSEIMTKSVETAKDTDGIQDIITKMRETGVRRIPVVDESGVAVGLISFGDLIGLLGKELSELTSVTPLEDAPKIAA